MGYLLPMSWGITTLSPTIKWNFRDHPNTVSMVLKCHCEGSSHHLESLFGQLDLFRCVDAPQNNGNDQFIDLWPYIAEETSML